MVLTQFLKMPHLLGRWVNRAFNSAASTTPLNILQQQRFKTTKIDCKHLEPKCGDRFKPEPCNPRQLEVITKQPLPPQKRAIKLKHSLECCGNPCVYAYPRFDLLYYKRSDKLNREYQQTWSECPELMRKPKVICCFDRIKQPKWKKRSHKERPQTACEQKCSSANYKCPRATMQGCRPAHIPPKCRPTKTKSNCKKRKAPFPAFSECSHKLPRPRHPIECRCLLTPSMCEVWVHHFKMQRIKKIGLC